MHHVLRQHRQLAAELIEDVDEDRDEEHQHAGHHERREHEHDSRVDHRALHPALDLLLLLDLDRDAVEDRVEHAGSLAGLDHRDVEAAEDVRVEAIASERSAPVSTCSRTSAMTTARAWSSVCSSRMTSAVTTERPASIIVANWREKTCSDFGCTFFWNAPPDFFLSDPALGLDLGDALGEQAAVEQDVSRRGQVCGVDLAGELVPLSVDRAVRKLRHLAVSYPHAVDHGVVVVAAAPSPAGVVVKPWMTSGCAPA